MEEEVVNEAEDGRRAEKNGEQMHQRELKTE